MLVSQKICVKMLIINLQKSVDNFQFWFDVQVHLKPILLNKIP